MADGMHVSGGSVPEWVNADEGYEADYYRTQWLNARRYMKVLEAERDGLQAEVVRQNHELDQRVLDQHAGWRYQCERADKAEAEVQRLREQLDTRAILGDAVDVPGLLAWWFEADPVRVSNFLAILAHHGYEVRQLDGTADDR